jgi:hypothetical protein
MHADSSFSTLQEKNSSQKIQAVPQSETTGWQPTQLKSQETILRLWTDVSPSFPWPQLVMARHSPQGLCLKCGKDPYLYRNCLQKHPFFETAQETKDFGAQGTSRTKPIWWFPRLHVISIMMPEEILLESCRNCLQKIQRHETLVKHAAVSIVLAHLNFKIWSPNISISTPIAILQAPYFCISGDVAINHVASHTTNHWTFYATINHGILSHKSLPRFMVVIYKYP